MLHKMLEGCPSCSKLFFLLVHVNIFPAIQFPQTQAAGEGI